MSVPLSARLLHRDKAYAHLDARLTQGPLWITAPAGFGKSMLVAGYLARRQQPAVWCRPSQNDAGLEGAYRRLCAAAGFEDLSTFVAGASPAKEADLAERAVACMRQFFCRLPAGTVVVFDGTDAWSEGCAGLLLCAALRELPATHRLILTSRAPEQAIAGALQTPSLQRLEAQDIRFDKNEVPDVLDELAAAWLAAGDGSAVALALGHVLKQWPACPRGAADLTVLWDRFWDALPAATEQPLAWLAELDEFRSEDLTVVPHRQAVEATLGALQQAGLVTQDMEGTIAFAPILRELLLTRHGAATSPSDGRSFMKCLAEHREQHDRLDDAAMCWVECRDWLSLARLLMDQAGTFQAQGRTASWLCWHRLLPAEVTSAHPWLQFWQATFIKYAEPGRARDLLRQVQDSLAGPDHATAQLLCLAGIIETHYLEWQDFSELPSLVRAMADRLRPELVGALDVQSDLVIHSRLVLGLMHCQPDLGPLAQGLKRTLRALPRCDSAVERLAAANVALNHFNWLDRTYMADSLIDEVDAIAMDPAMPPRLCVLWHCNVAIRRFLTHRLDEASARVALARDLASRHSLDQLVFVFQHADVNALLARGELEAARALIDRMHHSLQQHRKLDTAFLSLLEVNWACSAGDFEAAVHHAREALDVGEEHGLPVIWRAQFEATLANAHAGAGDFDAADQWYECAIHSAQGADIDTYEEHRLFTRAYGDFKGGRDSEGLKALKSALERNKARHGVAVLRHLPGAAALLADRALCHDVQVAYVHQWIERQRLSPPDLNNGQWPWPIALHALGNLALHRRGVPVVERGKAQLKPQALLALLLGAGRTGLARNRVTAQLWSDDEVTSPVKALEITVHRLRKWLGDDDAIVMHGNSIALDDNLVWSDVRALDRIYEWLDSEAARGAPTAELQRMTQHLLRMYRGPFCNGIDYPAINLIRDRCRRRFAGAADRLGLLLEARGELLSADALYTRALEVEPVAEVLYCGLMRVASARDDRASASSAYARCKQVLSVMLGMRPSVETERLAVELNMSGA